MPSSDQHVYGRGHHVYENLYHSRSLHVPRVWHNQFVVDPMHILDDVFLVESNVSLFNCLH